MTKQFKGKYLVINEENKLAEAEITGNLRFSAESNRDFPVVGDWVSMIPYGEEYVIQQLNPKILIIWKEKL